MSSWFESLKRIVVKHEPADDPHSLPRAAAVLMLEMAATDAGADEAELETIHTAMCSAFGLDSAELAELIAEAHRSQREPVSLYDLTRELRGGLGPDERAELIEWLWRVAYADGRLQMHEELLVRRLADLLGVPHHEFIRRKLMASS